MRHFQLMEWKRTVRILILALMLAMIVIGYSRSSWGQQGPSPVSLPELGEDDRFACVLFFGSDINGDLEPCG